MTLDARWWGVSRTPAIAALMLLLLTACNSVAPVQSVEALATSLAAPRAPSQPLPEELRRLQLREYDVAKDIAFAATVTALLDLGYRLESADTNSGLIVASQSSNERLRVDLRGLLNERQTAVVSAYVEERAVGRSRVRLNMTVEAVGRANATTSVRPVIAESAYDTVFARLAQEVAERVELRRADLAASVVEVRPPDNPPVTVKKDRFAREPEEAKIDTPVREADDAAAEADADVVVDALDLSGLSSPRQPTITID